MTLRVPIAGFADAIKRTLGTTDAYAHQSGARVIVSAGNADKSAVVIACTTHKLEDVRKELHSSGIHVYDGLWSIDDDLELLEMPYVVSVAYLTGKGQPGIWTDAFPHEPNELAVLTAMYEEFKSSGDMMDIPFEDFKAFTKPTVVIVKPDQLSGYVADKTL